MAFNTTQLKARKYYDCTWCGDTIPIGVHYRRVDIFKRTSVITHKLHDECYAVADVESGYLEGVHARGSNAKR